MAAAEITCLGVGFEALQCNDNDDGRQLRVCLEWCLEQAGPPGAAVTPNPAKIWAYGSKIIQKEHINEMELP